MSIRRVIGRPFSRIPYVRRAILEGADLKAFRKRPSARLVTGITLIAVSFLLGWPAVAVAGCLAVEQRNAWIFFIGGPTVYAVSWVVWGLGMLVAGRDSLKYANLFTRWTVRKVVEWFLGPDGKQDLIEEYNETSPDEPVD